MKRFIVSAAVVAALVAPASASAQAGMPVTSARGSFYLQPYAGYMVFGQLADLGNNADYSNEDGPIYGVQAGYSFSPNISLLGNFAYSRTKAVIKIPNATNLNLSGDLGLWLYDADLQFRLPFLTGQGSSTVSPFVQVGAGAVKVSADADDFGASGPTNVAFNFGGGVDWQISRGIGVRLMVKDYLTSLKWDELDDVDNDIRSDSRIANNLAFSAGLNFGF